MNFFVRTLAEDYNLATDKKINENAWESIKVFRDISKLPIGNDELEHLVLFTDTLWPTDFAFRTMAKIIEIYGTYCIDGKNIAFNLSSESLFRMVKYIDLLPKEFGFHYYDILRRDCELIVANPIDENCSVEQIAKPFQAWKSNYKKMQSRFIDTALFLKLIHRFIKEDDYFVGVNWITLKSAIECNRVEQLPWGINAAGLGYLNDKMLEANNE